MNVDITLEFIAVLIALVAVGGALRARHKLKLLTGDKSLPQEPQCHNHRVSDAYPVTNPLDFKKTA